MVEFLGLWEVLHNPNFKRIEFNAFKENAGTNAFVFSIKDWSEKLEAIGLFTKSGRYGGGIYAHIDIAFEFASWISPEFKLYIIKDYQRLKSDENSRLSLNWNLNREIAKLNYRIHIDAIKDNLIPPELTPEQISYKYANEADLLNVALFGKTAKQWRDGNPGKKYSHPPPNQKRQLVQNHCRPANQICPWQGNNTHLTDKHKKNTGSYTDSHINQAAPEGDF